MALGDVMSGEHRPQFVEAVERCRRPDGYGWYSDSVRLRNTKLLELRFRAWLTEEGTRQIELASA
jgi:hypothetical protein